MCASIVARGFAKARSIVFLFSDGGVFSTSSFVSPRASAANSAAHHKGPYQLSPLSVHAGLTWLAVPKQKVLTFRSTGMPSPQP